MSTTKQIVPTRADGWTMPQAAVSYFDTNGASAPTVFSADITSVTQVTLSTGDAYRVTFREPMTNVKACPRASLLGLAGDQLLVTAVTGEAGVDYTRVIDVQVFDISATAFDHDLAAGRRVVIEHMEDGYTL